jgi:hypothetical protein
MGTFLQTIGIEQKLADVFLQHKNEADLIETADFLIIMGIKLPGVP